jgi:hypothetical protein
MMIKGTDLSVYQIIDYPVMHADGIQFSLNRIGQGLNIIDSRYSIHCDGCDSTSTPWGTYLFGDYRANPAAQGKRLWTMQGSRHGLCPDWMDMEYYSYWGYPSGAAMYSWGCQFLVGYETACNLNHRIRAYMNPDMLNHIRPYLKTGDPFMRNGIAIAAYGLMSAAHPHSVKHPVKRLAHRLLGAVKSGAPNVSPFPRWDFWQYAGDKTVRWSKGSADLDYYNGTLEELTAGVTPTPTPTPTPKPSTTTMTVITTDGVNVRTGAGTNCSFYMVNGVKKALPYKTVVQVIQQQNDSRGNPWALIDVGQWVCINYNGTQLLK